MSEIVPYQLQTAWVATLEPVAALAQQIANTEFVPSAMRGNVAKVTACVLFGQELGLGPMQSLAKVDIIDGRPAPKAELARALVLAAGHEMIVVDLGQTKCTVKGRRRGAEEWTTVSWTMDDAKRAGLDGKQNWRKWPRQMLAARATAELARLAFADCLGGVSLFAEELQDDAEPSEVAEVTPAKVGTKRRLASPAKDAPAIAAPAPVEASYEPPLPDEIVDAEVVEAVDPNAPSDAQLKRMFAMLGEAGIKAKEDRLSYCAFTLSRDVTSSKELSRDDVHKIIDALSEGASSFYVEAPE